MQCLTTYEMDSEWIFDISDENCELPTRETNWVAWQILLNHVRENATPEELTDGIETWCAEGWGGVSWTCTDDRVIGEVKNREIDIDRMYGEDEILGCECVIDAMDELKKKVAELEEENEDYLAQVYKDGWKKGWEGEDICEGRYGTFGGCDGLSQAEAKVAELKKKVAELEKSWDSMRWELDEKDAELMEAVDAVERVDKLKGANRTLKAKVVELERQLAEFREWNEKMKDNGNEEWCRRCGSWQNYERDGSNIIKDAKWGCVCHDCLHHLDNPDHERCTECDCCKGCDCCECDEEETEE